MYVLVPYPTPGVGWVRLGVPLPAPHLVWDGTWAVTGWYLVSLLLMGVAAGDSSRLKMSQFPMYK